MVVVVVVDDDVDVAQCLACFFPAFWQQFFPVEPPLPCPVPVPAEEPGDCVTGPSFEPVLRMDTGRFTAGANWREISEVPA